MVHKESLARIRREAAGCRDCPLWRNATRTVFGEGPSRARLMLVGEQPGDAEDRTGHPFVGPAGDLPPVIATFHPSYLLRLKGRPGGAEAYAAFVADLRKAGRRLQDDSDS